MSKLTRVFQQLFMLNGSSSHSEQFGAKVQTGSAIPTLDPASIQAGAAFIGNGWLDAIVGANKQPYLEDMNGLHRLIFYQLCQMFQDGVPVWDPSTPYYTGSIVRKDGTSELYGSAVDNNVGNALPSQTSNGSWNFLNPQTVAVGTITAVANGVTFGNLLCDGTAYATSAFPNLSAYLAGTWDTFNGASSPGAGNFRVPDLRSLSLMGVGHGTGFSARTLAQLVGEETHTLTVPEIPGGLTVTDPGHSHNQRVNLAGAGSGVGISPTGPSATFQNTNVNTNPNSTGITVGGGGGAHNNMQPTVGVNYVIKT